MTATDQELSTRQERFCQIYAATGVAQRAAEEAGYSRTTARAQSGRLLANVGVAARIRELTQDGEASNLANGIERRRWWSNIMRDEGQPILVRLRASELLGKASGDFLKRAEHSGQIVTVSLNLAGPAAE